VPTEESIRPVPSHVGIIMDGNGRWAQARGLPRVEGHREGTENAKRIVKAASEIGIHYLTLFAFSTENWKRASDEVGFLMGLIRLHLVTEFDFYRQNRIRVLHSGDLEGLPADVAAEIRTTVRDTSAFDGLTVNLAINYGGRDEILRAVARAHAAGGQAEITEESFRTHLDQPSVPDPDLVIRTGGERRLSNFLLWESAYAELYFSAKLWPDWDRQDLVDALVDYCGRSRRFGGAE